MHHGFWTDQRRCRCAVVHHYLMIFFGLVFLHFSFTGYITRGCSQPEAVHITLKVLVSFAPICFMIIGLIVLYFYPIDEKRRQRNRERLREQW